ncbi:MAG: hypothetical protein AAF656_11285, partial [Planctomycetota bacterium]
MRRPFALLLVLCFVAAVPEDDARRAEEWALRDRLTNQMIDRIDFNEEPLGDALEEWQQLTDENLYINTKAIAAVGVSMEAPVTLRLRDVSMGLALEYILDDAAGMPGVLDVVAVGNIVHVAPADHVALLKVDRYAPPDHRGIGTRNTEQLTALRTMMPSLDLRETPLADALRMFRDQV